MGNSNMSSSEYLELKDKIKELEELLLDNTEATMKVSRSTTKVVEAFEAAEGAFKVLNFIGSAAKPVFWIISCSATVYGLITYFRTLLK